MKTGDRYRLPSGHVVQVRRLVQQDGQFVAECEYLTEDGRRIAKWGEVVLAVHWLELHAEVA